jgi:Tfp pilus assembly protein PilF
MRVFTAGLLTGRALSCYQLGLAASPPDAATRGDGMHGARWFATLVALAAILAACGARISEEDLRRSDRFYQAAYVSWFEEHDNLAAIRHLTRAVDANPENDDAHYLLGTIRLGRGELDEAELHLREAARLRGADRPAARAEVLNSLGVLLLQRKRPQEAVVFLEEAAGEVLNREPWLAMGNLGWAYIELGELDKAVETLRRALFDQPLFCVGLFRLGQAYYLKGDYANAVANLKGAVDVKQSGCDRMQDAQQLLGMAYLRLDRVGEARDALTLCEEIDPVSEVGVACAESRRGL